MRPAPTLDLLRGIAIGRATRPGSRVGRATRAAPRVARLPVPAPEPVPVPLGLAMALAASHLEQVRAVAYEAARAGTLAALAGHPDTRTRDLAIESIVIESITYDGAELLPVAPVPQGGQIEGPCVQGGYSRTDAVRTPSVQTAGARGDRVGMARWISTGEAAAVLGVDVSTLRAMVDRAPKTLPGAPVRVAGDPERAAAKRAKRAAEGHTPTGRTARRLRWDRDRLAEWASAYQAWLASRGRRRP